MKNVLNKTISLAIISSMLLTPVSTLAMTKDETVYTKMQNDGSISTVVSEHLKNDEKENNISDRTNLTDITNTNGDEKFTLDNNVITWESNGKDIYYQGNIDKELPIKTTITYLLDGQEVNPSDIKGKSGEITIIINYKNLDRHNINGNTLYTPFVVALTTSINNSDNSNIKVTNGKITSNGANSIIASIATPGLYESLNIDNLKSLNTITISYQTTNFDTNTIYTVATPKLVESSDLDLFTKLDGVYSKIDTLSSSSKLLVNGSKDLATGISTYNSKFNEYATGINQINSYSNKFNTSINTIKNGNDQVYAGISQLHDNTGLLTSGIGTLKDGSNKLAVGTEQLDQGVQGLVKFVQGLEENYKLINGQYEQAKAGLEQLASIPNPTADQLAKIEELKNNMMQAQISMKTIASSIAQLECGITGKKVFTADNAMSEQSLAVLDAALNKISTGSTDVKKGASELNQGIITLDNQSLTLVQGVNTMYAGATKVKNGIDEYTKQYATFNEGINNLNKATSQLSDGSKKLEDGANTLYEGLTKFDNEGIGALTKFINGDVKNIESKIRDLVKLSNNYQSFSDSNVKGNTKFITIIED